jgi:hypothetical protein
MHTKFWLEDMGLESKIILKCIVKKLDGRRWFGMGTTNFVNAVISIRFRKMQ